MEHGKSDRILNTLLVVKLLLTLKHILYCITLLSTEVENYLWLTNTAEQQHTYKNTITSHTHVYIYIKKNKFKPYTLLN